MWKLGSLRRTAASAIADLASARTDVRESAAKDLGGSTDGSGRDAAIAALERALASDESRSVRAAAALALADAGAVTAVRALVEAAENDGELEVRQMALLALGEVADPSAPGTERAIEVATRALGADAPALRFQALIALARIAPEGREDRLVAALDDDDDQVRYVALRLVEEHASEGPTPPLPQRVAARVRQALDDDSRQVALAAALLLAQSGDRGGAAIITDAVNSPPGTFAPEDEQTAIDLAGELALDAARPGLANRAGGLFAMRRNPFAFQARIALARLGDSRARAQIMRELTSYSRDTRTLAVVAAGRARLGEAKVALLAMSGDASRADPETVREALDEIEGAISAAPRAPGGT